MFVPHDPSFISTQFFVLNLVGWFGLFSNKFIIFLYSIIIMLYWFSSFNLKASITFCLNFDDIYFSLSTSSSFVSKLFFRELFDALVILSAILFIIKWLVASAVFWMTLFEKVLEASVADYLVWLRRFCLCLLFQLLFIFLPIFLPIFLAKRQKSITFYRYSVSWFNWIACHFLL